MTKQLQASNDASSSSDVSRRDSALQMVEQCENVWRRGDTNWNNQRKKKRRRESEDATAKSMVHVFPYSSIFIW